MQQIRAIASLAALYCIAGVINHGYCGLCTVPLERVSDPTQTSQVMLTLLQIKYDINLVTKCEFIAWEKSVTCFL